VYRIGQARRRAAFAAEGAWHYSRLLVGQNATAARFAAVLVGRNDDYMPDQRSRLRASVAWDLKHFVDEVIFVEWNPPLGRELLAPGLVKEFPAVRVYVVPAGIHEGLCQNSSLNLLEYHAKNVGIRRARADWILATNIDVAVAGDSVRRVWQTLRSPNDVWTAERVDIPWTVGREGAIGLWDCMRYKRMLPYDALGTGDFLLASRELWHRARGYDEALVKHRIGCDLRGAAQLVAHGGRIQRAGYVLHMAHPTSSTEGIRPHHGQRAGVEGVPYRNEENWGLGDRREIQVGERIWQLE
jgi:hypothetical protein